MNSWNFLGEINQSIYFVAEKILFGGRPEALQFKGYV